MSILVTGGAGYIGSHTVLYLFERGEQVVVLDNLSTGHEKALVGDISFYKGNIQDSMLLDNIFTNHNIKAVIHFAATSLVGESMKDPFKYFDNNVIGSYNLIKKMVEHKVKSLVFSSTAAIYGEPVKIPLEESDLTTPKNPYGETKLMIEKLLEWAESAYGLKSVCLRYFNAAGADPKGRLGEDHKPETHLIPIVLHTALGKRKQVSIYGDDYSTPDGTCIRDYIHVMDLAEAHYLALQRLEKTGSSGIYNLGNGKGFSVYEVIDTCREVTGKEINLEIVERRQGDPEKLIASSEKAKQELNWKPKYTDLKSMVEHAWYWHKNYPTGYEKKSR